jgi:hypothetical protein
MFLPNRRLASRRSGNQIGGVFLVLVFSFKAAKKASTLTAFTLGE